MTRKWRGRVLKVEVEVKEALDVEVEAGYVKVLGGTGGERGSGSIVK